MPKGVSPLGRWLIVADASTLRMAPPPDEATVDAAIELGLVLLDGASGCWCRTQAGLAARRELMEAILGQR